MSLDTHPANNALVVTYEITASVVDRSNQFEMARRNKRDQLQINISALDNLTKDDLKADKLVINLKKLSEEVVSKCPMLLSERHNLEDIQLHLLYLINRRQSQLLVGSDDDTGGRPASVSLHRLRSPRSAHMRHSAGFSRRDSLRSDGGSNEADVYSYLRSRESSWSSNYLNHDELLDYFVLSFDEHLTDLESRQSQINGGTSDTKRDLEVHLEGLYGDKAEKLAAMANLREVSKMDLSRMSSNRLLVCAMLRTLRDSDSRSELDLRQSLMFCLIKFTNYEDVYRQAFAEEGQPIDLVKLVADHLFDQVRLLTSTQSADSGSSKLLSTDENSYFYTTSLIVVMGNLLKLDSSSDSQILRSLLSHSQQQHDKQPFKLACLFELLQLITGQFVKELHLTTSKTLLLCVHRSIDLFNGLVNILIQLSIFKEFVQHIRTSNAQTQLLVASSLINLMSVLQFSRPGSGKSTASVAVPKQARSKSSSETASPLSEGVLSDKQTLNEVYELETKLMRLISNLLLDQRLRLRFIRRNLLKCVLRNVVVFLASRKTNSLSSFHQSAVLLEPFKCLYELSCSNEIRLELYKSKIIIKCLLEYLLSSTIDLRALLDNRLGGSSAANDSTSSEPAVSGLEDHVEIIVEPKNTHHFIISLWVNLSAQRASAIFGNDAQINQLVSEYIEASLGNLQLFSTTLRRNRWPVELSWTNDELMMLYLHLKLLRNVSQFFGSNFADGEAVESFMDWSEKVGGLICELVPFERRAHIFMPIAVECLATLGNLISIGKKLASQHASASQNRWPSEKTLAELLGKLFSSVTNLDQTENDDLILVSVSLLATIARHCEICHLFELEPRLGAKIIRASNAIFELRANDQQMILSSLQTLCQLTNHADFLRELSSWQRSSSEGSSLEELADKLAQLMLNGHQSMVAKLAGYLLIRLERLDRLGHEADDSDADDDQSERLVHTKRFSSYNGKWLAAIRASREEPASAGSGQPHDSEICHDDDDEPNEDEEEEDDDDDDCFGLLRRQAGSSRSQSGLLASFADELGSGQVKLFGAEELSEGGSSRAAADRAGSSSESETPDEDDEGDGYLEATEEEDGPDFSVVDANSMIKHLTSRREFRSKWLQR